MKPRIVLAVAVGGALGALARHALTVAVPGGVEGFPWTTFAINVTGSLLLALLPAIGRVRRSDVLPALLGTGVLGGFTTLSAVSEQSRGLYASGHLAIASAYLIGTLAAALLAVSLTDRLSTATERAGFQEDEGDR